MHTNRFDHASTIVSNKILVMGGFASKSVEWYNPASNKWSRRAPMLQTRSKFSAGTVNGFVYVLGGSIFDENAIDVTLSIERYCYKRNKWNLVCNDVFLNIFNCNFNRFGYNFFRSR